mmetsp:Transcript_31866/g.74987  ORF Transcript_31866/g.74987 Transcript_31866/m.74987 type:complete len:164 (-) Transcript_31866:427-918(-)
MTQVLNFSSCYPLLLFFLLVATVGSFSISRCRNGKSTSVSFSFFADMYRQPFRSVPPTVRGNNEFLNEVRFADHLMCRRAKSRDSGDDDDDDDDIKLDDEDWRAFRAKLVMGEKNPNDDGGGDLPSSDARTSIRRRKVATAVVVWVLFAHHQLCSKSSPVLII